MRTRGIVARAGIVLGLVASAVVMAVSCSPKKVLLPDVPPETAVFIQGAVDTVNHRVHLYWFGSDPDGQVVGYRMRFVYPPPAFQDPPWDTLHCAQLGRCTDSLFTMFTGDSAVVSPRFEIAAIDNDGLIDPTPAIQTFLLSNQAPTVTITNPLDLSDSTYASVTVSWTVDDPDGGGPGLRYRVWLDGNAAGYDSTTATTFTVPSHRFLQSGTYQSGPRTLFVQAVDDGGSAGPVATTTWYVRAPADVLLPDHRGRLLVIDDIPGTDSSNPTFDGFYAGVLAAMPAGSYSIHRPQFNPRTFVSARDFAQTLRQFRAVLWYRGNITAPISTMLPAYEDSIGAYLDAGGRLYLDGLYLIAGKNTPGALSEDFVTRHLGSSGLLLNFNTSRLDSTAGWSNIGGGQRTGSFMRSSVYQDTMRTLSVAPGITLETPGIRGFAVTDTQYVALWAMERQLNPANVGFEVPVGVSVPHPNGGRIVLISHSIRLGSAVPAARILQKILLDPTIGLTN